MLIDIFGLILFITFAAVFYLLYLYCVFILFYFFIFDCAGPCLDAASEDRSPVAELRLLTAVAPLAVEHGLQGTLASGAVTHTLNGCRFSSCGTKADCSATCGIFPHQGSNLCFLHWQADSFPQPPGKPCLMFSVPLFSFSCCPSF